MGELEIKGLETTEFRKAGSDVLQGRRVDAVREARPAEILELREERQDVLHARADGADAVREAIREQPPDELAKRLGPARFRADEDAPVDAQVRHGGEEGRDGAERREAVAKLDREPPDGRPVDVLHLRREVAREEEEVPERLERQLAFRLRLRWRVGSGPRARHPF